ncbi:pyridoxal phosphate-dependent aminotransferase [Fulvivirga sediminis]|uniref:Histidinol-phosphate aminotransferase family protein n=1 Tax=Fulvivirga sediminis TaxID=2803949 RepID=A0A937F9U3_9BACT|nr:histidinol-phosphate transaminase [Fulvivirga sediminis]MBL3656940.1 histidinol-phosphate aminotransferase family protein [Fulvivirga sediminis]
MNAINRRTWLRSSLMSVGGAALLPHLSFGETAKAPLNMDKEGRALYSPFFKEYIPANGHEVILKAKLNANENPYGPSPKAVAAFREKADLGNRYAWKELLDLIEKIAEKEGVSRQHLIMGPGSSDLLEKVGMVFFFENGGNVVSADPSYMSLMKVAEATGAEWKPVPLKEDWSHDLDAMEKAIDANTKLVYICNPNNPTGTITDADALYDFCSRVSEKVPVFVDEAYLDFLPEKDQRSMVSLVSKGKNVIVARTFSKIHGMAGLRVGYVVGLPETLNRINKITRGGMGISLPSVYAAKASMDDLEFQNKTRKLNNDTKDYVYKSLKKLGFEYVPSYTNFMIFPIAMEGQAFLDKMYAQGVGVRSFNILGKDWCRVSMGTMDEMKMFTGALQDVAG